MNLKRIVVITLGSIFSLASIANATECFDGALFGEENGVVIMETENLPLATDWEIKSDASASGGKYISWEGSASSGSAGPGQFSTKISFKTTGVYRFLWSQRTGEGTGTSEANDSWLRFADAADYYGEKNANSGTFYTTDQAGKDGWFKVYGHSLDFKWDSQTKDNDAYEIMLRIDNPGVYTMEIAGRSQHHHIDKIAIIHSSANTNDVKNNTPTETACDESTANLANLNSVSSINHVNGVLTWDMQGSTEYAISFYDLAGALVSSSKAMSHDGLASYDTRNLGTDQVLIAVVTFDNHNITAKIKL